MKFFIKLKFIHLIQAFTALSVVAFLSSCATTLVSRNNQAVITIPEGVTGQIPAPGQTMEWGGGKNEAGYAHGPGTETWFGPDGNKVREADLTYNSGTKNGPYTIRHFAHGKLIAEGTGTYVNNMVVGDYKNRWFQPQGATDIIYEEAHGNINGMLHGQRLYRCLNGERIVSQYQDGSLISTTTYNRDGSVKPPPVTRTATSSSSDDSDILGAMVGMAGVAAGSGDLTMSGVSMMAGDDAGAMQHLQNFATSAPSGGSTTTSYLPNNAGVPRSISSQSRNVVTEGNLVDKYGLGKYRNQQDHISHYLTAADEAYGRYKQTGDSAYYDQHREYADLAKQLHQQTATTGTKLSR